MRRGDVYLVRKPTGDDPKRQRAFIVVSRQVLVDSDYATVICAPVYGNYPGLATQVEIGTAEGLKHDSAIHCDGLVSLPKSILTNYRGTLADNTLREMDTALKVALAIED
jgi:mRNA interferase MazF